MRLVSAGSRTQGLISALGIPPDDFFQIIHLLPPTQFPHTRSFLGLKYSEILRRSRNRLRAVGIEAKR